MIIVLLVGLVAVGLGLVVFVVGWLLVPFILCTNCVTGPTKVTLGEWGWGGVV